MWKKPPESLRGMPESGRGVLAARGQVPRFDYEQVCGKVRQLQRELEQSEAHARQDRAESEQRMMDNLKRCAPPAPPSPPWSRAWLPRPPLPPCSLKLSLEESVQDRDSLLFKFSEIQRENERLTEQLACSAPQRGGAGREVSRVLGQRDELQSKVAALLDDKKALQQRLEKKAEGERSFRAERDRLLEGTAELKHKLDAAERRTKELEAECQRWAGPAVGGASSGWDHSWCA